MISVDLQIMVKGHPVSSVPENSEVELHLVNQGQADLCGLSLYLGGQTLRAGLSLRPGAEFVTNYNVSDLVGELTFSVRQTAVLGEVVLTVTPGKLTSAEVEWIKTTRLPFLLARLAVPNRLRLDYSGGQAPEETAFDFVSADYTAQRLHYFCQTWLDRGLYEDLLKRLDFVVEENDRREAGFIRGQIRWKPTIQGWQNHPAETGLVHQWVETGRNYDLPLNQLLVFFLQELAAEVSTLVRLVRQGVPASGGLKDHLADFETYARGLQKGWQNRIFGPVVTRLNQPGFQPAAVFSPDHLAREAGRVLNPAYLRLVELWQEYRAGYVRLSHLDTASLAGWQPMSVIYELWVACEIAAGLELTFRPAEDFGLASALFENERWRLVYNQAAPDGWYSQGSRKRPPRPDLRLVSRAGQNVALLDVKYRLTDDGQAQPDDMYRMLAYMNDLRVGRGLIIFPGHAGNPALRMTSQAGEGGQSLGELSLRPPANPVELSDWQVHLKQDLAQFLGQN